MVTLEDVALEVGCSVNTVSRALNNKPDISKETKKKVLEAARKLGYIPNTLAKSFVTKTTNNIGLVVPSIENSLYSYFARLIEHLAFENGYNVFLTQSNYDIQREFDVVEALCKKRVDGIISVPIEKKSECYTELKRYNIPVVTALNSINGLEINYIGPDNRLCAFRSVCRLLEAGCKNVLLFDSPLADNDVSCLRKGYEDAYKEHDMKINKELFLRTTDNSHDVYYSFKKFLVKSIPVDGIYVFCDDLIAPILKALDEHDLSCPRDIKIIGYGNTHRSQYARVSATTNDINIDMIAKKVFSMTMTLISEESPMDIRKFVTPSSFILRTSCP